MKKYGDDADSFYDQGTRVEESKRWHEQNTRRNYSYRSQPNPSYSKSSYKPSYTNQSTNKHKSSNNPKSAYKPNKSINKSKSSYKPRYSNKSINKSKSSYKPRYSNKSTYKTTYSLSSNYSNSNRKTYHNRSTSSSNSNGDTLLIGLFCICGILALWISVALNTPMGFFPILIGLWGILYVIFWFVEELPKKFSKFEYDKNISKSKSRLITTKSKIIIGFLAIGIIIYIYFNLFYDDVMFLCAFILPAIFLIIPYKRINSSKFLALISIILSVTLLFYNLQIISSLLFDFYYIYPIILFIAPSLISLLCAFLLLISTDSNENYNNNKKINNFDLFKQTILFSERSDYQSISKSKAISWILFILAGYSFINSYASEYGWYTPEIITYFIIIGSICAGIIFIILTFLDL